MRCKNCGWNNPDDITRCQKCDSALEAPKPHSTSTVTVEAAIRPEAPVFDSEPTVPAWMMKEASGEVVVEPKAQPVESTEPDSHSESDEASCQLRIICWEGENVDYPEMTFDGPEVVLNRANTDRNNHSITSKQQAVLECINGEWYLDNRSQLRSTFLRVNRRVKLQKGDIIVLGNREFEFKG